MFYLYRKIVASIPVILEIVGALATFSVILDICPSYLKMQEKAAILNKTAKTAQHPFRSHHSGCHQLFHPVTESHLVELLELAHFAGQPVFAW